MTTELPDPVPARPGELSVDLGLRAGTRLLVLRGLQYALVFVGGLITARTLGPTGRASYALPLNLALIGWLCFNISMEAALARLLSRGELDFFTAARASALATVALGGTGALAVVGVGLAFRAQLLGDASALAVVLAASTVPVNVAGLLAAALVFRRGRLRVYGITQVGAAATQLGLLLAFVLGGALTPESTLAINLVTAVALVVPLVVVLVRDLGPSILVPRVPRAQRRALLRTGAALHASSLALLLNLRLDLLLVGTLVAARSAGLYSLSTTLAELVFVATSTIGVAALQAQTELEEDEAVDYTVDFVRQTLALAVVFALVAAATAYPLVVLAYGEEWRGAVAPFVILTAGAVGLAVESPVRTLLLRVGRPRDISLAALAATLLNVLCNFAVIPVLGIVGAAIVSTLSYWAAAVLMLALMRRATGRRIRDVLAWPRRDDLVRRATRRAWGRRASCAG